MTQLDLISGASAVRCQPWPWLQPGADALRRRWPDASRSAAPRPPSSQPCRRFGKLPCGLGSLLPLKTFTWRCDPEQFRYIVRFIALQLYPPLGHFTTHRTRLHHQEFNFPGTKKFIYRDCINHIISSSAKFCKQHQETKNKLAPRFRCQSKQKNIPKT